MDIWFFQGGSYDLTGEVIPLTSQFLLALSPRLWAELPTRCFTARTVVCSELLVRLVSYRLGDVILVYANWFIRRSMSAIRDIVLDVVGSCPDEVKSTPVGELFS